MSLPVIFLFSLLALVQAIPGPGLQRSGSPCQILPVRFTWTSFEVQDKSCQLYVWYMWDRQCVYDWLEGNGYTVQFEDNSAACQLKLTRPNQAAPDHQIVQQVVPVDEYTLIDYGEVDFDPQGHYPCEQDYTVELVCEVKSEGSQTPRYVLVAKSDQFEICGSDVKRCDEWREEDEYFVPWLEGDVEELLEDNTCSLASTSHSFVVAL